MFSSAQFLFLTQDGVGGQLAAVQLVQRPAVEAMPDDRDSLSTATRRSVPLFRRLRLATS
jgi:hypothetical protein